MSNFFDTVPTGYTFDDMLLVPAYSKVMSRKDPSLKSEIVEGLAFDVPIISANMPKITEAEMINEICSLGGTGCLHRFMSDDKLVEELNKIKPEYYGKFGISLGVNKVQILRTLEALMSRYTTFSLDVRKRHINTIGYIIVDVAHGHHILVKDTIEAIRSFYKQWDIEQKPKIIGGNICTVSAAQDLINWGVDGLKVGIGPGSCCSTRTTCGVGYPQLSVIKNISIFVKEYTDETNYQNICIKQTPNYVQKKITVIADGGCKTSGDIVKALAAGADFIMLGSMIAGCKESPGQALTLADGSVVKVYGGSASIDTQATFKGTESKDIVPEGVTTLVKYKGGLRHVMGRLVGGVKSGFSYCGCKDVEDLHEYGEFPDSWVKTTLAGYIEGTPHITNSK